MIYLLLKCDRLGHSLEIEDRVIYAFDTDDYSAVSNVMEIMDRDYSVYDYALGDEAFNSEDSSARYLLVTLEKIVNHLYNDVPVIFIDPYMSRLKFEREFPRFVTKTADKSLPEEDTSLVITQDMFQD